MEWRALAFALLALVSQTLGDNSTSINSTSINSTDDGYVILVPGTNTSAVSRGETVPETLLFIIPLFT